MEWKQLAPPQKGVLEIKWKGPISRKVPHLVQEAKRENRSLDGREGPFHLFRIKQVYKTERLRTMGEKVLM